MPLRVVRTWTWKLAVPAAFAKLSGDLPYEAVAHDQLQELVDDKWVPIEVIDAGKPVHPNMQRELDAQKARAVAVRDLGEGIFNQESVKLLLTLLRRPIPTNELSDDERALIIARADKIGTSIFSNNTKSVQGRTLEGCILSARTGVLGEVAILHRLREGFPHVALNDETVTGEYYWDIMLPLEWGGRLLLELKYQSYNVEGFSFDRAESFENSLQHWKSWDLVIGWKLLDGVVIPHVVINNEAFNPHRALYQPSMNGGTYLQWKKAMEAKLMKFIVRERS